MIKSCVFQRGQVLTSDSNTSKFIYIIKSGSLSVWAKVKNKKDPNYEKEHGSREDNEASYFIKNHLLEEHHLEVLNEQGFLKSKDENERLRDIESKIQMNQIMTFLSSLKNLDKNSSDKEDIKINKDKIKIISNTDNLFKRNEIEKSAMLPKLVQETKFEPSRTLKKEELTQDMGTIETNLKVEVKKQHRVTFLIEEKIIEIPKREPKQITFKKPIIKKNSFLADLNRRSTDYLSQYVLIQRLYPGEHFSLADLLFDSQPSLLLISNTCECILIQKEFFILNSSVNYLKELRKKEAPFPRYEEIENKYKGYLKWRSYAKKEFIKHVQSARSQSLNKIRV